MYDIKKVSTLFGALALMLMSACASLERHEASFRLITQYAVLKFIEQAPADHREQRAERIFSIATSLKPLVSGDTSLELLQGAVALQLDQASLSPADRVLANALVLAIVDEARIRIGEGVLTADQRMKVEQVLDWVISASRMT